MIRKYEILIIKNVINIIIKIIINISLGSFSTLPIHATVLIRNCAKRYHLILIFVNQIKVQVQQFFKKSKLTFCR